MPKYIFETDYNPLYIACVGEDERPRWVQVCGMLLDELPAEPEPVTEPEPTIPEPEPVPQSPSYGANFQLDRDISPQTDSTVSLTGSFAAIRDSRTRYLLPNYPIELGLSDNLHDVEFVGGMCQVPWRYEGLRNIKFTGCQFYDTRGGDTALSFKVDGLTIENCRSQGFQQETANDVVVDDYVLWIQESRNLVIRNSHFETGGRQAAIRINHTSNVICENTTFRNLMEINRDGFPQRSFRIHGTGSNYYVNSCNIEGRGGYVGCAIIAGSEWDALTNVEFRNTHFNIYQNGLPLAGNVLEVFSFTPGRIDTYPRPLIMRDCTSNLGTDWLDGIRQWGADKGWVIE